MEALAARRPKAAAVAAVVVLTVANLSRRGIPPGVWHLVLVVSLLGVARWAGLGLSDLGLGRDRLRDGLRLGGAVFAAISAVVLVGGLIGLVSDDRADVSAAQMALRVLVLIPFGTVLVEELAFRGALHGLLHRALPPVTATVAGAVLFGLWHVFPAATGGGVQTGDIPLFWLVLGTFAATTVAGFGFEWLRGRSGSVVAPMLAHLATNSTTFAVAWAFG